jgi:SMODS-associated and fused to various effectors sensor domain/TIR domain
MNSIFISYSGSRAERAHLFYALRDHGLRPWRDVESLGAGGRTTELIERELASCSGAILWINEELLASDYVALEELPAIAKRLRAPDFRLVPLFDGMTPSEGSERISRFGIEIGENQGHIVDPSHPPEVTAAAIAAAYVRSHVSDAHRAGERPVIRLVSYDDTAAKRDKAVLNLDWRHRLEDGSLSDLSFQLLQAALKEASAAVKESYGACEIEVVAKAHLPLATAVGYAFSEPIGCTIRMARDGVAWSVSRRVGDGTALRVELPSQAPVSTRRASIEVAVSREIDAGVRNYIGDGNRYRHRVVLTPPDGISRDAVRDPESTNSWARQIGQELINLTDRGDVESIDVFLACPVELAVAIGWWANAAGPINLMNWKGKNGPYERMWVLP